MKPFLTKYLIILTITSLFVLLLLRIFQYPLYGVDDANIFFVYAKNIASGHGFVYNVGGERIEGFTSLLWVLLCTVAFALSSHPELLLLIITKTLLCFGITLTLTFLPPLLCTESNNSKMTLWQTGYVVLLFSLPAYIAWNTITLMENALWSTLLLVTTILVITAQTRSAGKTNLLCAPLLVMMLCTRPESFLWVPVFIAVLFIIRLPHLGFNQALKSILVLSLCYVLSVTALTLFRISYFGYPLPNTFYAKVSPSVFYNLYMGLKYLVLYFISSPLICIYFLALGFNLLDTFLNLFSNKEKEIRGPAFLPVIAGVGLLIPVMIGGDHFGSFRFYQNIYPILILNLLYYIRCVLPKYLTFSLKSLSSRLKRYTVICTIVTVYSMFSVYNWYQFQSSSKMDHEFLIAEQGRERGQFMHSLFSRLPKLPRIGVVVAGAQKLTYPGEVVDLMGLNNNAMAKNSGMRRGTKNHAAFEKATFFQLTPDIVTPEVVTDSTWLYYTELLHDSFTNEALKGLYDDRQFHENYVLGKVSSVFIKQEKVLVGWIHKDFLTTLKTEESIYVEICENSRTSL